MNFLQIAMINEANKNLAMSAREQYESGKLTSEIAKDMKLTEDGVIALPAQTA